MDTLEKLAYDPLLDVFMLNHDTKIGMFSKFANNKQKPQKVLE